MRYMKRLQNEEPELYQKHFSKYIAENLGPEDLYAKYEDVHRKIRANPSAAPKKERDIKTMKLFPKHPKKLTAAERQARRIAKIAQLAKKPDEENDVVMDVDDEKDE